MFIRKLKNRSGSTSVQIISKSGGKYKVVKTIGSAFSEQEILTLCYEAKHEIEALGKQQSLFLSDEDALIESYFNTLHNSQIQVIGPELVFGRIYDAIGFSEIKESLFRHLVVTRLVYPGSKLKTIDYLRRYQGIEISSESIYRFLDKLHSVLKRQVEDITFVHTLKVLKGEVSIVFYDLTTLYFESADEDDLRKTGYSKDGKYQHPQIYLGLLVGLNGYPIGYDIFQGNISEGHTLIPTLRKFERRFGLSKPIVVADAGLLSGDNIILLEQCGYQYILGARIKNEAVVIKDQLLQAKLRDGQHLIIKRQNYQRLIVAYSDKRATKDEHNRKRGLIRLEKNLKAGRLTKSHINNKGYNKYLKLTGDVQIEIDYNKFKEDKKWDGLKGYLTNTKLSAEKIIQNYKNLWQIEKAFRISKTDLQIRPIYHRIRRRIEAHICIAFTAYAIYKELERMLSMSKAPFSATRAALLTHTMYQISFILPESKKKKQILLKMDEKQQILLKIIDQNL